MPQTKFFSIREFQQQGSGVKNILGDGGKIIITNNGKPIGLTVGVSEDSLEQVLEDWKRVEQLRHLRFIDHKLDESEKLAADPNAEWIDDETFWSETEAQI
jgi:antitoxin (DNA-binding transcriptional repressor) of toxin-antitoxin stability system